jgi:hypothetical protein
MMRYLNTAKTIINIPHENYLLIRFLWSLFWGGVLLRIIMLVERYVPLKRSRCHGVLVCEGTI